MCLLKSIHGFPLPWTDFQPYLQIFHDLLLTSAASLVATELLDSVHQSSDATCGLLGSITMQNCVPYFVLMRPLLPCVVLYPTNVIGPKNFNCLLLGSSF